MSSQAIHDELSSIRTDATSLKNSLANLKASTTSKISQIQKSVSTLSIGGDSPPKADPSAERVPVCHEESAKATMAADIAPCSTKTPRSSENGSVQASSAGDEVRLRQENEILRAQLEQVQTLFQEMVKENSELRGKVDDGGGVEVAQKEVIKYKSLYEQTCQQKSNLEQALTDQRHQIETHLHTQQTASLEKLNQLQINLDQQQTYCKSLQETNAQLSQRLQQATDKSEKSTVLLNQTTAQIKSLQGQLDKSNSTAQLATSKSGEEVAKLHTRLKQMNEKLQENEFFVNTLTTTNSELNEKAQKVGEHAQNLQKSLSEERQKLQNQDLKVVQQSQEIQDLLQLNKKLSSDTSKTDALSAQLNGQTTQVTSLKSESATLKTTNGELEKQLQFISKELKNSQKERSQLNDDFAAKLASVEIKLKVSGQELARVKTEMGRKQEEVEKAEALAKNATKNLRDQLRADREGMRKQCKLERDNADKARQELLAKSEALEKMGAGLAVEKMAKLELEQELNKNRSKLYESSKTAADSQRAMMELAREQQKMQTEKVSKDNLVWIGDESVENCSSCGDYFTVFRRRHHCRGCGKIFCQQCSPHRAFIPGQVQKEPQRCCNSCAEKFSN